MTSVTDALSGGPRWVSPGHPFTAAEIDTAPAEVSFVVTTSGSTGRPKSVMLRADAVRASALATQQVLGDGAWVLALPAHFVAGLMVLVRGLVTDQPVQQVATDLSDLAPDGPTHLSLVPTQLVRALDDPDRTARLADCASVLLGGAPASPEILDRARAAGITVHTTYGMSETCGGCVYDGVPLDGVRVRIDTEEGGGPGRILLGGPTLLTDYRTPPGTTVDPDVLADDGTGPRLRTNDLGRFGPDGRLQVLGRVDEVVNTGGHKVVPGQVNTILSEHPKVAESVVVGRPDPEWGERVCAVVVPSDPADPPVLAELRSHVRERLPAYAAPRELDVRAKLPMLASGKPDLVALRRPVP